MAPLWATLPPPRIELTCAADGQNHLVVEPVYGAALATYAGRCIAECGHIVVMCSMFTPPGPLCPLCLAAARLLRRP